MEMERESSMFSEESGEMLIVELEILGVLDLAASVENKNITLKRHTNTLQVKSISS